MKLALYGANFTLLVSLLWPTPENNNRAHPLAGVWLPNPTVNEVLGVPEKKLWPYGFEIRLGADDFVEAVGTKEDLETLLIVAAQHKGAIAAEGTFAFLNADGTHGRAYDCVLTEKAGITYLSVPAPYQAPVFAKVTFVQGTDSSHDLVFFTWPPDVDGKAAKAPGTSVGFSRKSSRLKKRLEREHSNSVSRSAVKTCITE